MMLDWDSTYEIVLALMRAHPNSDIEAVGLHQLHQMIITLPDFGDAPAQVGDDTLEDILILWYEEVNT